MIDFTNIDYLKAGNSRQQLAHQALKEANIFELLAEYNPLLTGTIPIGIDLPDSDLDIICQWVTADQFECDVQKYFSHQKDFKIWHKNHRDTPSVIASFQLDSFQIEIFGQPIPVVEQMAYRHMLIEHKILMERGDAFRREIIRLKASGTKTEPAFAKLLGLSGDPYQALLALED